MKIILDGCKITQSTNNGHISTEKYVKTSSGGTDGNGNPYPPSYDWVGGYSTSAKIDGTCKASTSNVFVNSKKVILKGDNTLESDSYTLASNERYAGGKHTNAQGSVTGGNSNNVYVNGKLLAVTGATVTTHASNNTTVGNDIISTNVNVGS